MKVIIRVDSGTVIANGHVMRCLTLASKLTGYGAEVVFVCKKFAGNIISVIEKQGFKVLVIPCEYMNHEALLRRELGSSQEADAIKTKDLLNLSGIEFVDWIIVDHYALDEAWHKSIKDITNHIFVIDDLANRNHFCDVLLDQTLGQKRSSYKDKVPDSCELLLGTEYTLLRDEFLDNANKALTHRLSYNESKTKSALIMMGGTDPDDYSGKVLDVALRLDIFDKITIVLGLNAPHLDKIQQQANLYDHVTLRTGVDDVADMLIEHDLCFGAAGTSAWERCALGLPSMLFVLADNQEKVARELASAGAVKVIFKNDLSSLAAETLSIVEQDNYLDMVRSCVNVCDGQGALRVAEEVCNWI
ncbi:UDP-2,4-diacetamido-2,4,6-trideoxy-beta-L-altropyranose hydrolase [Thalassotalea fusca]